MMRGLMSRSGVRTIMAFRQEEEIAGLAIEHVSTCCRQAIAIASRCAVFVLSKAAAAGKAEVSADLQMPRFIRKNHDRSSTLEQIHLYGMRRPEHIPLFETHLHSRLGQNRLV
jgi:hypothetical protein